MKIIHTADWHLGKRLNGVSRLGEQRIVLQELIELARVECADIVIAAGDIYDTSVPTAEAEELFYETAVELTKDGRIFVALAGNHDDPSRLAAPEKIARVLDIILIGGYDNSAYTRKGITGGDGFIKIEKNGEVLNLAVMPYPQHSKLSNSSNRELSYSEIVKNKLDEICGCFNENEFNVLASHLFMSKSVSAENLTDERELGTAALLSPSILPKADYTALGHIHKPFTVSSSANVVYSGSLLAYSFDDTFEKSAVIVELKKDGAGNKNVDIKRVPLRSGKKLLKIAVRSYDEAVKVLNANDGAYVHLEYCGNEPLKQSEVSELKKLVALNKLVSNYQETKGEFEFKERTDEELFSDYYKHEYGSGAKPSDELMEMFLNIINNVDTDETPIIADDETMHERGIK